MIKHIQTGCKWSGAALRKLLPKKIAHLKLFIFILFLVCLSRDLFAAKVGLRPMPVDRAEELSGGGHVSNWESGIGNYEEDMDRYGFVARNLDTVYRASEMFWTDKIFFEWYIDISDKSVWVNTNPETNTLVERIRQDESRGRKVEHIIIAREGWLYAHLDGLDGPIEKDPRILYQKDVDELREVFREAHNRGILNYPNYKLIQMVVDPLVYFNDPVAREIIKTMDGVTYESHQFGDNWPLWEHKSNPQHIADGANWVLGQGLEFIFYYGPIRSRDCRRFGESQYPEEEIEKKWLEEFWAHGLPKNHQKMNYYLNIFPFWCGAKRMVGPEDNADSKLGFTKWLIEEIKQADLLVGPDDFIFSPLVFEVTYYYNNNPDLQSIGLNAELLRAHWRNNGIAEGRKGHPDFSPPSYLAANSHIRDEFGENYMEAIRHYIIRPSQIFDPRVFDIDFYRNKHADLLQEFGADNDALRNHWRYNGIEQGRQAHAEFSVRSYLERYPDLKAAFGDNYHQALRHYFNNGIFEGRNGLPQAPESCLVSPLSCYVQINGGEWRQILISSVPSGGSVRFGPALQTNGSWTWNGPGDFSSSAREVVINDFRKDDSGAYVVTFARNCGAITMRQFMIVLAEEEDEPINDVGITPFIRSNEGEWLQQTKATLCAEGSVSFSPHAPDGSWQWTGPDGFIASTREVTLDDISTAQAGDYVATYTNMGSSNFVTFSVIVHALSQADVEIADASGDQNNGAITLTFAEVAGRSHIGFSIDGGGNYMTVPNNSGTYTFSDLAPGDYEVWSQWGNSQCPIKLGNYQLSRHTEEPPLIYFDRETFNYWTEVGTDGAGGQRFAVVPPSLSSPNATPHSGDHFIGLHIPAFSLDRGYTQDSEHDTLIMRSPEFTLSTSGDLTAWLSGGGSGSVSLAGTSVAWLPAVSSTGGFLGVALRNVTTGIFVLSASKSGGGNEWEEVTFTAAQLGGFPQGDVYTLDLIDVRHGGWGWVNLDSVTIPGILTVEAVAPDFPRLTIQGLGKSQVRLAWPAAAVGWTLQSAADLNGDYSAVGLQITVENDENAAYDTEDSSRRFYRLVEP